MEKVNLTKDSKDNYFHKKSEKEDSVFNSKLFLNMEFDCEHLNNSYSTESDNSDEIKDENSLSFLTKDLIEELNSSNSDYSLKNDNYYMNNRRSFLYYVNNKYDIPPNYNELLFNNLNQPLFIKCNSNCHNNSNKKKYNNKKYKLIKDRKRDWVCQLCQNLNYAFRIECNRCHQPKENCIF